MYFGMKSNRNHTPNELTRFSAPRLVAQRQRQGFLASVTWVRASACTSVTPAVSYLPTGLAGCLVDPGISYGARKLAWTPRVTQKKKNLTRFSTNVIKEKIYLLVYGDDHSKFSACM